MSIDMNKLDSVTVGKLQECYEDAENLEEFLATRSPLEVLEYWMHWDGIIGFTRSIINMYEDLKQAQSETFDVPDQIRRDALKVVIKETEDEWCEDAWFNVTPNYDVNIYIHDGEFRASLYRVIDSNTNMNQCVRIF